MVITSAVYYNRAAQPGLRRELSLRKRESSSEYISGRSVPCKLKRIISSEKRFAIR